MRKQPHFPACTHTSKPPCRLIHTCVVCAGAAKGDPTGDVSITLLDEDLLTVDDDELLPFTTSYSSNVSTEMKKAASKARSHVPLFGDVGRDDDHSGLFGKTPITARKYSALFAGEDVVDPCDDFVNKTASTQQPAAASWDNSEEDRAHDLYGKKLEWINQSADMIGNVGPGDFFGKPATISEASSKERYSILFDDEERANDLASPLGAKVLKKPGPRGLFDDVVGAQEVGGLFGKKPEVAGTHERYESPSILNDGQDTEKTVRGMPDTSTSVSDVLSSVVESDKKADSC